MNPISPRVLALALATVVASSAAVSAHAQAKTTADSAVLMISIDGLHPSYVLEADRFGAKIPVLRSFVREGAYAERVINVTPTVTYPNHTALVTGTSPREHGIYTNVLFDPLGLEQGAWYWYGDQIKVPTLWDKAKAQGMTTAAVLWPVSVGHRAIDYNVPEYWRNKRPYDNLLMGAISTPRGFLESVDQTTGHPYYAGPDGLSLDSKSTDVTLAMIEQGKPQLLTLHLVALDGAQHENGPLDAASVPVLEQIDAMIGRIVAAQRKVFPDSVIAIVSDHGFHPVNQLINLNAALAQAGLIELTDEAKPKVKDWQAFSWNSGGSAFVVLKDPADAVLRGKVERILGDLAAKEGNGIGAVLAGENAQAKGAPPQASFLVDCRAGYAMGSAITGAVVTPTERTIGTHGYLNTHPEMASAFFVTGPGIEAGRNLGQIDIRSIAPTLGRELGLELEQATHALLPLRR